MRELERDLPATTATTEADPASLAIVGAGRVGRSLAAALGADGAEVRLLGRGEAVGRPGAALLCVPDEAIADLAEALAAGAEVPRFVGHTSGAAGLDALVAATEAGAATFSVHPLQTFPDGATDLTGCPCAISGSDDEALSYARALAERLGMRPFEVDEHSRTAYHAAASIASNFLVALEESAAGLLARVGVDEARELLTPLVLRAAANWAELGPRALTGPIARGDSETVRRHLVALREHAPELIGLYEELAERARAVAAEQAPQRTGAAPR